MDQVDAASWLKAFCAKKLTPQQVDCIKIAWLKARTRGK